MVDQVSSFARSIPDLRERRMVFKLILTILLSSFFAACSPQAARPTEGTDAAIIWQRSGGIAGICQRLTVERAGSYKLLDCSDESLIAEGALTPEQWEPFSRLLDQYGAFQYSFVPPEGTADMFTDELSFHGTGSGTPDQTEQAAISEQLAQLVIELSLPTE
jgi:hypothetical protein